MDTAQCASCGYKIELHAAAFEMFYKEHNCEKTKLQEAIQRVRELHKPFTYVWGGEVRNSNLCVECEDQDYPCDTIKALDGEQ